MAQEHRNTPPPKVVIEKTSTTLSIEKSSPDILLIVNGKSIYETGVTLEDIKNPAK